jgi:hypothetical protein
MAGHLFITRGDIRHLACHAWLLPTDRWATVEGVWRDDTRIGPELGAGRHQEAIAAEPGWKGESVRAVQMLPRDEGGGAVWLGNVGGHEDTPVGWVVDAVVDFVKRAAEATTPDVDPPKRDRPLLAIPFVGTGEAGLATRKGEVVRELVERLGSELGSVDADVVLVTRNDEALAAAQRARRIAVGAAWAERWDWAFGDGVPLPDGPYELGRRLGEEARHGRLVLFVGAGVSAGAGLPQWNELLDQLADGVVTQKSALERLPYLDQATVIATALGRTRRTIGKAVAELIPEHGPYALAHSLIATLPVTELVTTNYDTRLESAADDAERPLAILDGRRTVAEVKRWLLKLHGSVDDPERIVLSRDDYLGYGQRRAALRGVVQAMLMTRHMVFVGFGLSDDNFHAIAHDVRSALRAGDEAAPQPFGTALLVRDNPLFDDLWRGDITRAALAPEDADIGVGARRVELMLDLVLAESEAGLSHFMDPAFDDLLDGGERDLRDALKRLWTDHPGDGPAWEAVGELMKRLGGP